MTAAFLVFAILGGGIAELVQRPDNVEGMMQLGYPVLDDDPRLLEGAWIDRLTCAAFCAAQGMGLR